MAVIIETLNFGFNIGKGWLFLSCRVWENYPEVLAYSFDENEADEHRYSVIGKHYKDQHQSKPCDILGQFSILKKCRGKLDCFFFTRCYSLEQSNQRLIPKGTQ